MFGICLGHQLMGLALGGKTYKLKFGHHGGNHPVQQTQTGKVEITAHNHNFAVDPDSIKQSEVELTHIDLNDNTLEGLRHRTHAPVQRAIPPRGQPRPARLQLPLPRLPKNDGRVEEVRACGLSSCRGKSGLTPEDYPYLAVNLDPLPRRLTPLPAVGSNGGAEAPPLRTQVGK